MKINELQLNEKNPMDWVKSKLAPKQSTAEPQRQEPTLDPINPTPDFSARLGNFAPMPPAKVTGPNTNAGPSKTSPTSQIPNTTPTVAPTNTVVYPPKTTDTTQAILPPQNPSTPIQATPGTVPNTNVQMPGGMGTYPSKPAAPAASTEPDATGPTSDWTPPTPPLNDNPPEETPPEETEPTDTAPTDKATGRKQDGVFKQLGNWYKAKKAGSTAGTVRNNSIQYQLEKWMGAAQGLDTDDVKKYQDTMARWASANLPQADPAVVQQAVADVDPNKESTITRAIGDIYNSYMMNRAIAPPKAAPKEDPITKMARERLQVDAKIKELEAEIEAKQKQLDDFHNMQMMTSRVSADAAATGGSSAMLNKAIDPSRIDPETASLVGVNVEPPPVDEPITVGRGEKPLNPKDPADAALIDRLRQAQQQQTQWTGRQNQALPNVTAESQVDFGAMLFDRMKSRK